MGLVGLGSVRGSQKTTPLEALEALDESLEFSVFCTSAFSLEADKIELCDTPVECDFEMSEAAEGVAFCSTGRPMTGLEGTKGNVEDLGSEAAEPLDLLSSVDVFHGRVEVFDNKGMVAEDVGGNLGMESNVTEVVTFAASTFLRLSTSSFNLGLGGGGGGGAFFFLVGEVSLGFVISAALGVLVLTTASAF